MDRDWIDELLTKTDIINVISRYVQLVRKGNDFWGCCPFHHEKEPSFKIYRSTQTYHCFGCKESGNAITFLSKIESIDRIQAIKLLADEAGMKLPEHKASINEAFDVEKAQRLHALLKDAARFYFDNLSAPGALEFREYLQRRGIDNGIVKKFGLGASLSWEGLIAHLESKGYSKPEMKEAGVAEQKADSYYDVFRDRLMFPIIDSFGNVISFSGRTLSKDVTFAKYRNGPQTLIFDKSKALYGINLLKKKKQKEKIGYVIIVEGHIDCIAMHAAGYDTTVASMGTALTYQHAKQLKNYSQNIYISYDGDAAGGKATLRSLDILANAGLDVLVVNLPEGKDPDDIIKEKGKGYYEKLLKEAMSLTAYKIFSIKKKYDLSLQEGKAKFAIEAVRIIRTLKNPIEQEEYLGQIAAYTGYSMDALKNQAEVAGNEIALGEIERNEPDKQSDKAGKVRQAEIFILAALSSGKPYAVPCAELDEIFESGQGSDIYGFIKEKGLSGLAGLYNISEDNNDGFIGEILSYSFLPEDGERKYRECINAMLTEKTKTEKEFLAVEYERSKDLEILKRIQILDKKLKHMKISGGQHGTV